MNRLAATLTVALSTLAIPVSALAATSRGTVLSVDRSHHVVQVVDASHVVHAYRYRKLAHVGNGSRIRFKVSGANIAAVKNVGTASTVSFYGKVVRSSVHGLVLRLADGNRVIFGPRRLGHVHASAPRAGRAGVAAHVASTQAGQITINIVGLQPGETVLVTESTDAQGNPTITIELTGTPSGGPVSEQQVSGVVTDVQNDTFTVTTTDGSVLNLHMAKDTLSNLNLSYCDQVSVSYHPDQGLLIADSVHSGGSAATGPCVGDSSSGSGQEALGKITSVSAGSVLIDQGAGQGTLRFTVGDSTVTDGFAVGDMVDVSYSQNSDGSLSASDVEYVEADASGVVTAVGPGTLTITDDSTGSAHTFTADPTSGLLDGVLAGDQVDVTYHVGAGGEIVDNVGAQAKRANARGLARRR